MLKVGVIGCGFMGELHCKIYSNLEDVEFAGIFDADSRRALDISNKYGVKVFKDHIELLKQVNAASIAAPTILHHKIALDCINNKCNLLIEKPIAATLIEAEEIVEGIRRHNLVSAVGFIERFNPSVIELLRVIKNKKILSVEAIRLAPPANRANDVSVVFDLMIHDLDIILAIINSPVKSVEARGEKINSQVLNDVSASLKFDNGAKASIKSNKVADKKQRLIKIICDDCTIEADFISKTIKIYAQNRDPEIIQALGDEPIRAEIVDFINAVENKSKPRVSAQDSLKSFSLAWEIEEKCHTPHR